ncbi:LysR family transcriptional regulator [Geodermatophilus sp. SYSU D00700]
MLTALALLDALLTAGTVDRAAEASGRSSAAVRRELHRLEAVLNIELVTADDRPSDAAHRLRQQARTVLDAMATLLDFADSLAADDGAAHADRPALKSVPGSPKSSSRPLGPVPDGARGETRGS